MNRRKGWWSQSNLSAMVTFTASVMALDNLASITNSCNDAYEILRSCLTSPNNAVKIAVNFRG